MENTIGLALRKKDRTAEMIAYGIVYGVSAARKDCTLDCRLAMGFEMRVGDSSARFSRKVCKARARVFLMDGSAMRTTRPADILFFLNPIRSKNMDARKVREDG